MHYQFPSHPDAFHHAYMVRGSIDEVTRVITDVFQMTLHGHPDVYHYQKDVLKIEEARRIREQQSLHPVRGVKTIFVIEAREITFQAQNALLKVFEDPSESTIFFLVVERHTHIVPTLSSRLIEVYPSSSSVNEISVIHSMAYEFLDALPAQRIEMLADIYKEKNKQKARFLLDQCEVCITHAWRNNSVSYESIVEIIEAKKYMQMSGCSLKLLLEHLAFALPRISNSSDA